MTAPTLAAFLAASFLVVISPGPATLYVLRCAETSAAAAARAVAGIVAGDIILITLSALGFAALVAQVPALAAALKLVGAGYVAWVGISLLRAGDAAGPPAARTGSDLAGGFLITLANPKAILFFAAFFPMFMPEGHGALASFLKLGLVFEAVNLAFFALFITAARSALRTLDGDRLRRGRRLSGAGLLLVALFIAGQQAAEAAHPARRTCQSPTLGGSEHSARRLETSGSDNCV